MTTGKLLFWAAFLGAATVAGTRLRSLPAAAAADEPALAMAPAPQAPPLRVLFIGNSLTYSSDMPRMLMGLARAGGINLEVTQHAPGGRTLEQHAADGTVRGLLARPGWSAVVLQEQSQRPAFADEQVRREVDAPAARLAQMARATTPRVRILLYQTPARRSGDAGNARPDLPIGSYDGMQQRVNAAYRRIAFQVGGTVVPAGAAWQIARRERPAVNLYGDDVHPNREGAYLIACVFYARLSGRSPSGSSFTAGVDPAVAAALQSIAWRAAQAERQY
jgi:hypothetical protein